MGQTSTLGHAVYGIALVARPDPVRDSRGEHRGAVPTTVELVQEGITILVDEDFGNNVPAEDI